MGKEKEYFTIKAVHRDHLEELGFDAAALGDGTMMKIANILEEIYCELRFWPDLKDIADDLGISKKKYLKNKILSIGGEVHGRKKKRCSNRRKRWRC